MDAYTYIYLCFLLQKSSPRLKNVLRNNLSSHIEGPVLNLLLSFLNFEHVQAGTEKPDPICSLFMPSPTGAEGMHVLMCTLCAAVLNLV